jgi:hypothetical protein
MCCALHSSTCCRVHCPVLDKEQVLFFICCIFLTIIYFVVILRSRFSQCSLSCTESSRPKWDQVVTCIREVLRSRFGLGQVFRALATTAPFLVLTNSLLAIVQLCRNIQSGLNRLHRVLKRFFRRCGSGPVTDYWFPAFWSYTVPSFWRVCTRNSVGRHDDVNYLFMKTRKEPFVAYFERHCSYHSG